MRVALMGVALGRLVSRGGRLWGITLAVLQGCNDRPSMLPLSGQLGDQRPSLGTKHLHDVHLGLLACDYLWFSTSTCSEFEQRVSYA